ncbi:polysaccharide deacetylase family protein [Halocalculus aciditolerans]|uniref:NodB homology domain-containing protein n=1 Tax=Halocalculus aciditolerans TaxID=1383812 RepID=A0A830FHJ0_9EURY|nr:polysaccharide deacetylase family protein [Halocalculus aciditolerans]GGL55875.1 hypothetical protein GCM10009039_12550 [Halocalculus aciditolerans]
MTADSTAAETDRTRVLEPAASDDAPWAHAQATEWPVRRQVLLTLDLERDFGTAVTTPSFDALDAVDDLAALLERYDVPLTCFVQTAVLDRRPGAVETLRDAGVDVRFHPHSHTHRRRDRTQFEGEIRQSTRRYRDFFDRDPVGYRVPDGNVRPEDYDVLVDEGYAFDASLFPSWRPGRFSRNGAPTTPHYLDAHDLFEIPFTVYSERVRVPTALSYCRLLGRPYTTLLCRRPPPVVMFNIHMHDLVTPPAYDDLPAFYKAVYARNPDGFGVLERAIRAFDDRGYSFATVDHVHDALRTQHS